MGASNLIGRRGCGRVKGKTGRMFKILQWVLTLIGAGTVLSIAAAIGYLLIDDYMVRRRQEELEAQENSGGSTAPATV